jgi:ketosteroid isomerase-like protein
MHSRQILPICIVDEENMRRKKVALILCCLFLTPAVFAQTSRSINSEEVKLIALEKMWNQAQLTQDANALQGMLGDRFVSTEWDGVLSSRERFLAEIADPKFKPSAMSIDNVKVEFYGDTAVIVGIYHTKGVYNGKPYDHVGRFTDTWVRQGAGWKCVASHTSLIQK